MTAPESVPEWLRRAAERGREGQDGIRVLDRKERPTLLSWAQIADRARRAASVLAAAGVGRGDAVAIVLPTSHAFFDAYLGAQWLGAVPVPLYPPVRIGRLDEYWERTSAMLRAVRPVVWVGQRRIASLLGGVSGAPPWVWASSLLDGDPCEVLSVDADAVGMVQFSSGTTVAPKPVALTHRQMLANASCILDIILSHGQEEPGGVSWLPLYHDMGLIGCLFPAMMGHGPLTLLPPELFLSKPASWLRAITRYPCTVSPAPNFAYALCAERVRQDELSSLDLSRWKMALNGAEPIAPSTLASFTDRFAPCGFARESMTPVYGLSEASLALTFGTSGQPPRVGRFDREAFGRGHIRVSDAPDAREVVSVGRALRGFEVEVRDTDGRPATGLEGRIWARGPSVMNGYLGDLADPVVNGWLDTGDLGFVWEDELYISGRAKDVIVLRGRNHAPQEIEAAASGLSEVRTGCVVAVGDLSEGSERLVIFAETARPTESLEEGIVRAVRAACGVSAHQVVLVAPGTIPRTSSGKRRRAETLRRWRASALTSPKAVTGGHLARSLARSAAGYLSSKPNAEET